MEPVSTLPFGTVLRRNDGLIVMYLCNAVDAMETDEIGVNPGNAVGFVLARGTLDKEMPSPYWPLHGTCSFTDIQKEGGSISSASAWEVVP